MAYSDRELIARIVQCEAGGEGDSGMKAVATVIMNRVRAPERRICKSITRGKYKKYYFSARAIWLCKREHTK